MTTIDYKSFTIEIEISDDEFDNTIKVLVRWKDGCYDDQIFNKGIKSWWDSGESEDRREWIGQALNGAIKYLENNWI